MTTLSQSTSPVETGGATVTILVAVAFLIILVFAFGLFTLRLRRRLLADEGGPVGSSMLLDELRQMLRRGEISQAEYDCMRQGMVEKLSALSASSAALSPSAKRTSTPITPRPPPKGPSPKAKPGFDLAGDPLPNPEHGD